MNDHAWMLLMEMPMVRFMRMMHISNTKKAYRSMMLELVLRS